MWIVSIFDLEYQGGNLQSCTGILLEKFAHPVEQSNFTFCFSANDVTQYFGFIVQQNLSFYLLVELLLSFRYSIKFAICRYLRDFEIETIGKKRTPRRCSDVKCGVRLNDTVLDWEVN